MKKIKNKVSLVLLLILTFVMTLSASVSLAMGAASASAEAVPGDSVQQNQSDEWYEITHDDNTLTVLFDAQFLSNGSFSATDFSDIKNQLFEAFRALTIDKLAENANAGPASHAIAALRGPVFIDELMGADPKSDISGILGKYEDLIRERLKDKDENGKLELENFLGGEYDAAIEYAVGQYIEEHKDEFGEEFEKLQEKVNDITEAVQKVVEEVIDELAGTGEIEEGKVQKYKEDSNNKVTSMVKEVADVIENGGTVTLSFVDLINMLRNLTVNDDIVLFSKGKFQMSGIKQLLETLPKAGEIAQKSDDEMRLSYSLSMVTTLGESDFNVVFGFKGDCSAIRNMAQFIADHVQIEKRDGAYNISVNLPEGFSALMLKLSESSRLPDDFKHALFALFDKKGNEFFDESSGFTFDKIVGYLKNTDFQGIFSGLINAEKIKSYFSGFGVDVSKLDDKKIDDIINRILGYAEQIANHQTVENLDEFIKGLNLPGVNGVPANLRNAVGKFLNLLNEIDYGYWNAETVKSFIKDKSAFDSKIESLIQRFSNSATTKDLYNKFVDYFERALSKLPESLSGNTLYNLYSDGKINWNGEVQFDLNNLLSKIVKTLVPETEDVGQDSESYANRINSLIDTWFDGQRQYDLNVNLNITTVDIYSVEYMVDGDKIGAGLLPIGADVNFYANFEDNKIDGKNIIAWVDEEGTVYKVMPEKDVTLYPVTEFDSILYVDDETAETIYEKTYDETPYILSANAENGYTGYDLSPEYEYKWFKDDEEYSSEETLSVLKPSDSGEYYCEITYRLSDGTEVTSQSEPVQITISKIKLDLSGSYWAYKEGDKGTESKYESDLTYSGKEFTVKFVLVAASEQTIPEGIELSYTGTYTKADANNSGEHYTATVEIVYGDLEDYYEITKPDNLTLEWKISPKVIDLSTAAWNYTGAFTYDGTEKSVYLVNNNVELKNGHEFFEGVSLVYTNASAINADDYTATVGIEGENIANYQLVLNPAISQTLNWSIEKAKLALSGYNWQWSAEKFEFDGSEHEVSISNPDLAEQLEISRYENNKKTEVGTYTAKAYFAVKEDFAVNYEIDGVDYVEHAWSIENSKSDTSYKEKSFTFGEVGLTVGGNVTQAVLDTLKASESKTEYTDEQFNAWVKDGTHAKIVKVYSISMQLPEGFTGTIKITVTYSGFENTDLITVHVPNGVSEINKDTCNALVTTLNGTTATFNTDSFSDFVIVDQIPDEEANLWWVWLLIAIIILLLIIAIILIVLLINKNKGDGDKEKVSEATEETAQPEEESKEEVVEEPVSESEPVVTEEVVEQEPVVDTPDETAAVVAEEPVSAPVIITPPVEDNERLIYDKSFVARLSQSDNTIKSYYSELKNEILAYQGVKSRVSWHFDSFNKGREKCIKLQLRGKSLYMYIALNPADVDEKYHAKDVSDKERYVSVPTMVKIKKPRSLKYAKQLVEKLMENMGVVRGETPKVKYKVEYKSTEALIEEGLIKIKVAKNNFIKDNSKPKTDGNTAN